MERIVTFGLICVAPLTAKCFPSHHCPFKHENRTSIHSTCLQLRYNYNDVGARKGKRGKNANKN